MNTATWLLTSPLTPFWLALLLGAWHHWRQRRRWARALWGSGALWLFLVAVSPLPAWLAAQREARYPVLLEQPAGLSAPHILVLGGGHTNVPGLPAIDQLSGAALGRLAEGIRLYRQRPGSKLIGSGHSRSGRTPQGEMLMRAAVELGVPPEDTLWLPTPANTEQEAYAYAARFGPAGPPLLLVTDALHLPRAVGWFQRAGLAPLPAPANHLVKLDPQRSPFHCWPAMGKLGLSQRLLHEWAGMAVMWWRDRGSGRAGG
jgi:uncharacterized SAM-binding protein YcdF (DUF218 family)